MIIYVPLDFNKYYKTILKKAPFTTEMDHNGNHHLCSMLGAHNHGPLSLKLRNTPIFRGDLHMEPCY